MKKISIVIRVVHNNNFERNSYLFPLIGRMTDSLADDFLVERANVGYQPSLETNLGLHTHRAKFELVRVQIHWIWHLRLGIIKSIVKVSKLLLKYSYSVCKSLFISNAKVKRLNLVERAITSKHVRCWLSFLETNSEYLLCLEDDVIFRDISNQSLLEALKSVLDGTATPGTYLYLDIAGGFSVKDLGIEHLETKRSCGLIYFSRPVSNTACFYLISRSMAEKFSQYLLSSPNDLLLPIDWLINKYMMKIMTESDILCAHAWPSIFIHGSMQGHYDKWRQSN